MNYYKITIYTHNKTIDTIVDFSEKEKIKNWMIDGGNKSFYFSGKNCDTIIPFHAIELVKIEEEKN